VLEDVPKDLPFYQKLNSPQTEWTPLTQTFEANEDNLNTNLSFYSIPFFYNFIRHNKPIPHIELVVDDLIKNLGGDYEIIKEIEVVVQSVIGQT
ncbi:hypothetical protein A2U01_0026919, partial [Trifolium medium]|nr:hypothetical protein [Trifolium medium]